MAKKVMEECNCLSKFLFSNKFKFYHFRTLENSLAEIAFTAIHTDVCQLPLNGVHFSEFFLRNVFCISEMY